MSKDMTTVKGNTALTPRSLDSMLGDFFTNPWRFMRQADLGAFKIDLAEDEKAYTIEAEMPGVKKEDITIDLDDGELTIGVAAREKEDETGKKVVRSERRYSYMERSIYLPDAAEEGVDARLDNGELIITIPKQPAESRKRKIEIK